MMSGPGVSCCQSSFFSVWKNGSYVLSPSEGVRSNIAAPISRRFGAPRNVVKGKSWLVQASAESQDRYSYEEERERFKKALAEDRLRSAQRRKPRPELRLEHMPSLADFSWNSIASEDETKTERAQILLKKTKDPDPEISAGAWTILRRYWSGKAPLPDIDDEVYK